MSPLPSSKTIYDPSGDPDNPGKGGRAADNDPGSTWSTSQYDDQFPALKPGIGLMTTFRAPAKVAQVVVRCACHGRLLDLGDARLVEVQKEPGVLQRPEPPLDALPRRPSPPGGGAR